MPKARTTVRKYGTKRKYISPYEPSSSSSSSSQYQEQTTLVSSLSIECTPSPQDHLRRTASETTDSKKAPTKCQLSKESVRLLGEFDMQTYDSSRMLDTSGGLPEERFVAPPDLVQRLHALRNAVHNKSPRCTRNEQVELLRAWCEQELEFRRERIESAKEELSVLEKCTTDFMREMQSTKK